MPFIGIIADEKKENYIKNKLINKLKFKESSILFIKEKSIENIKNIKFETILLDRKFNSIDNLKKILTNAKYIIINTDIIKNLSMLENLELTVITYGFNSKATITASSVTEDSCMICIQRNINNIYGNKIEPQEIKMEDVEDINSTMAIVATLLVYEKSQKK